MSTGEQPLTDGWDIHRDNDGKGQDSRSDRKGWNAGPITTGPITTVPKATGRITTVFSICGEEIGADAQDDKTEDENDAWKRPGQCEARRGIRSYGILLTENDEADGFEGFHIISS